METTKKIDRLGRVAHVVTGLMDKYFTHALAALVIILIIVMVVKGSERATPEEIRDAVLSCPRLLPMLERETGPITSDGLGKALENCLALKRQLSAVPKK